MIGIILSLVMQQLQGLNKYNGSILGHKKLLPTSQEWKELAFENVSS